MVKCFLLAFCFLQDQQKWLKSEKPFFTLSYIAEKSGLKSRGHVSLIIKGTKGIPENKIELYADIFFLEGKEKEFFVNLVRYNQEALFSKKKTHLDKMVSLMHISDKKLVPTQYKLCEKWFYPIVLEILRVINISDEYDELAEKVLPKITSAEASEAVKVLESIGMIKVNDFGFWKPTDIIVTFGEGWNSLVASNFQAHSIARTLSALSDIPVRERDISTMTLSMSEKSFYEIKEKFNLLTQEVLAMIRTDNEINRVYQVNLSLFPVSEKCNEENSK